MLCFVPDDRPAAKAMIGKHVDGPESGKEIQEIGHHHSRAGQRPHHRTVYARGEVGPLDEPIGQECEIQ